MIYRYTMAWYRKYGNEQTPRELDETEKIILKVDIVVSIIVTVIIITAIIYVIIDSRREEEWRKRYRRDVARAWESVRSEVRG